MSSHGRPRNPSGVLTSATVALVLATALCRVLPVQASLAPSTVCYLAKYQALGAGAQRVLGCHADAARHGVSLDPTCASDAFDKFAVAFAKAETVAQKKGEPSQAKTIR